ncbi:autotransporter domain-containing protein, partial [Nostoc sp. NIES-2111]
PSDAQKAAAKLSNAVSGNIGIVAETNGNGTITIATNAGGTVTGTETGISAVSQNGAIDISVGAEVKSTGYEGLYAGAWGDGSVSITTSAKVWTTGANPEGRDTVGIGVEVAGGQAVLDIGGDVSGPYGIGISSTEGSGGTAGGASVRIAAGATVSGTKGAIGIESYTGAVTIDNAGRIEGSVSAEVLSKYRWGSGGKTFVDYFVPSDTLPTGATKIGDGTAELTLTNTGTISLSSTQSITGFTVTNESGGILTGAGSFGAVVAKNGSFLQPGTDAALTGAGAVMTVSTLDMQSGSTLRLRASINGSTLTGDSLLVTQSAAFDKDSVIDIVASPTAESAWTPGGSYRVVSGSTSTVTITGIPKVQSNLTFLTPTLTATTSEGKRGLSVQMGLKTIDEVSPVLTSNNQRPVAAAILRVLDGGGPTTPDGRALVDRIVALTNDGAAPVLEQLSGSSSTGGQTAAMSGSGLFSSNVITQTLVAGGVTSGGAAPSTGGSNAPAYTAFEPFQTAALKATTPKDAKAQEKPAPAASTWRLWATGLGAQSTVEARASSPRITGNDWGLAAGFDYAIDPALIAGVSLGGTSSRFSVASGATTGTTEGLHTSLYGIATFDQLYVAGSLGYGRLETRAKRTVSAFGTPERYDGKYATDAFTGQTELGYRIAWEAFTITPFAGLQATLMRQHAYTESAETAGGVAALAFKAQDAWSVPGQLGLQVERGFALDGGWSLTAQARAAWVHEFSTERKARPSFVALPGSSFTVDGIAPVEDFARLTGGVTLANDTGTSLFATLTSDLSKTARTYAVQGGLKVAW